jgi:hypothetical protein
VLQPLARGEHEVLEVEQSHASAVEKMEHPAVLHERQQMAPKNQAIEPGQRAGDERSMSSHEAIHGVLLGDVV